MRTFKTLGVAVMALTLMAFSLQAQTYSAQTLPTSITYVSGAAGVLSNNVGTAIITCNKQQNVAIQVGVHASAASTDTTTFWFASSVDGSKFNSGYPRMIPVVVANNGDNDVYATTNITVGGIGYLKLVSISNAAATAVITNLGVKYSLKINAP